MTLIKEAKHTRSKSYSFSHTRVVTTTHKHCNKHKTQSLTPFVKAGGWQHCDKSLVRKHYISQDKTTSLMFLRVRAQSLPLPLLLPLLLPLHFLPLCKLLLSLLARVRQPLHGGEVQLLVHDGIVQGLVI